MEGSQHRNLVEEPAEELLCHFTVRVAAEFRGLLLQNDHLVEFALPGRKLTLQTEDFDKFLRSFALATDDLAFGLRAQLLNLMEHFLVG